MNIQVHQKIALRLGGCRGIVLPDDTGGDAKCLVVRIVEEHISGKKESSLLGKDAIVAKADCWKYTQKLPGALSQTQAIFPSKAIIGLIVDDLPEPIEENDAGNTSEK